MNYWPEYILLFKIQTAAICIITIASVLIAASSIKRTRLLERKERKK